MNGHSHLKLLTVGHIDPQRILAIAPDLGFPLELVSKTLLLQTLHTCTAEQTRRNQADSDFKASSPLFSFHSDEKVLCMLPEEKINHQPYSTVNPASYNNN